MSLTVFFCPSFVLWDIIDTALRKTKGKTKTKKSENCTIRSLLEVFISVYLAEEGEDKLVFCLFGKMTQIKWTTQY